jgi:NAD(P)-dependent dehydrogenase (short-subunit alcohol dehydrogenase family)
MTNHERYSIFDLTGKVALVTGAAAGLGRAIAVGLAQFGADVLAVDIDKNGLDQTVAQVAALDRKVVGFECDTSQPAEIKKMFNQLDILFSTIDILVNNVGVIARAHPEDLELEDWERVIRINMTGTFLCAQEAGRRMIAGGRGGSIINISSIAGVSALGRGNFVYSTTKGAINQLTRELAIEWANHNIRVNAILPAQMRTSWVERLASGANADETMKMILRGIPLNRLGEPEDIVGPVVFLASGAGAFITGALLPVDGGNLALNAGGSLNS